MAKKAFFDERTPAQIRKLDLSEAWRQNGLVERILGLEPEQGLVIRSQLIPGKFFRGTNSPSGAARKFYKHGDYIISSQPKTIESALENQESPNEIRKRDFEKHLVGKNEDEIQALGYSFRPIQGRDRRKRLVPFNWILEGARLFAYADSTAEKIPVKSYHDARRVEEEGASVVVTIPAREEKKTRYNIRATGIPVFDNARKHTITWGFNTTYAEGKVPEHALWSFRYVHKDDQEQSDVVIMYPHDLATSLGIARHFLINEENPIPWHMSPFAKPSEMASDFYRTLCNNVLIGDNSVRGKDKTRKLYVPEKSLLLARLVGTQGPEATMFWKAGRDPKLTEYDWSIPK